MESVFFGRGKAQRATSSVDGIDHHHFPGKWWCQIRFITSKDLRCIILLKIKWIFEYRLFRPAAPPNSQWMRRINQQKYVLQSDWATFFLTQQKKPYSHLDDWEFSGSLWNKAIRRINCKKIMQKPNEFDVIVQFVSSDSKINFRSVSYLGSLWCP